MSFKKFKKQFKKALVVWLVMFLALNPLAVRLTWAQETEEPPVGEASGVLVEEPAGGEVESQTEPPDETQVATGDAAVLAEVDNNLNTNEENLPGEISTPEGSCAPPEGGSECEDELDLEHHNLADATSEATASAKTGENEVAGAEAVDLETGTAVAGVGMTTQANTNLTELEGEADQEVTATAPVEPVESPVVDSPELAVENENLGTVTNTASALADTGDNTASGNHGDVVIRTGDAVAWANLLNFLNTNIVGSSFEFLFFNLLESQALNNGGDINLNEVWGEIIARKGSSELNQVSEGEFARVEILVQNFNQAVLENRVTVTADTGGITANANGDTTIETGNAATLANVINFVNTNILSSEFLFFVINILDIFEGDIILPRAENFTGETGTGETPDGSGEVNGGVIDNQNLADLLNYLDSSANTGQIEALDNGEETTVTTGNAAAFANILNIANLNIWANDWLILIINVLSGWDGSLFGWSSPSAQETVEGSQQLETGQSHSGSDDGGTGDDLTIFENQSEATVRNYLAAGADTGGITANANHGSVGITTGDALSIANLLNFVNLNIFGGRWMIGIINVIGSWTGDLIFAYPDVVVDLTNGSGRANLGETTAYFLSYLNQGYDSANDVWVSFELPEDLEYLGDSSGLTPVLNGSTYSWFVGSLGRGEGGSFAIQVRVRPDFSFGEQLTWWDRLVPVAHAAEAGREREAIATALIDTRDPESNLNNNFATVGIVVYEENFPVVFGSENQEVADQVDQRQPILEVTVTNNVNGFVYPGDTVTFEVKISNRGEVPAAGVVFYQELRNGFPDSLGMVRLELGTIGAKKGVVLTFGLQLSAGGKVAGEYHTYAWAQGLAPNGTEIVSDQARTDFRVKAKYPGALLEAKAAEKEEILGVETEACLPEEALLPWVIVFLVSSAYLLDRTRRWRSLKLQS